MTQVKRIEETEDTYYISYAVDCNTTEDGDETALVINGGFYILNGDWVDRYKECKNKEEQKKLFIDNYDEHGGFWSDDLQDLANNK